MWLRPKGGEHSQLLNMMLVDNYLAVRAGFEVHGLGERRLATTPSIYMERKGLVVVITAKGDGVLAVDSWMGRTKDAHVAISISTSLSDGMHGRV